MSRARPNILLIMSDEHDAGVMGCYGDRLGTTPHLDRLAAEGVAFDACYCASPLCVPARLALTAGRQISRIGAWNNHCRLDHDEVPSLARVMRQAGYQAWLAGKQHYHRSHRYGFAELVPGIDNHDLRGGAVRRRAAGDLTPNTADWQGRSAGFGTGGLDDNYVLRQDIPVIQAARGFLLGRSPADDPFLLLVGLIAPHFPLIVPPSLLAAFAGRVPEPRRSPAGLASLPLNYRHLRAGFGVSEADPASERLGRECYWAMVHWMDGLVGQLLAALRMSRVADDTVVIYTSDHGENKGDHHLWWKNSMHESSARVPLLVSWPARWAGGQRRSQVCSHLDLVQTILALGGQGRPEGWTGDPLLDLLDRPAAPWRNSALCEYYAHNICSGYAMLRQDRWKYTYHTRPDAEHGPERELYDLASDPGEEHNLAAAPEQQERIDALHRELVRQAGEEPDATEQRCRAARPYPA